MDQAVNMPLAVSVDVLHREYSIAAIFDALRARHALQGVPDEEIFVIRYGEYFYPTPEYKAKGREAYRKFLEKPRFPLEVVHDLLGPVLLKVV